jgi:hypothetical protein
MNSNTHASGLEGRPGPVLNDPSVMPVTGVAMSCRYCRQNEGQLPYCKVRHAPLARELQISPA